ncbi:MAG: hypothetical protein H7839_10470 [Magnetococcus sp. YQC-5]
MGKHDKTLWRILSGRAEANLSFEDLRGLVLSMKFEERIRGDRYIFSHDSVLEILNLQPQQGDAKPYRIKQVRNMILKYKLGMPYDDTL